MKWAQHKKTGFTIVELLIVIVVIAILASITIVAYNGIQNQATESSVKSELSQNVKKVMAAAVTSNSSRYATTDVMTGGSAVPQADLSRYKVLTYCTNGTDFVFAAETKAGKKYYAKSSSTVTNDDSIDAFLPCPGQSVSGAYTTYMNLPTVCATENTTCTFSGTATVVYGSASQGRFNRLLNQTGSVGCNNSTFTDPASGYGKACYVYPN